MMTDRRSFIAALAMAPVAIAAPAIAAPTASPVGVMCAEYLRLNQAANEHPFGWAVAGTSDYAELAADQARMFRELGDLYQRILATPSRSGRDIADKLIVTLRQHEGFEMEEADLVRIADDARHLTALLGSGPIDWDALM